LQKFFGKKLNMDKLELNDGSAWLISDLKSVLQEVYDHYRSVANTNEWLRQENERLKSEAYKDEELSKMKESYEKLKEDYFRGFPISEKEKKEIDAFVDRILKEHPWNVGCIGGRFVYEFIPTSIGILGTIKDPISGEKLEFRKLL